MNIEELLSRPDVVAAIGAALVFAVLISVVVGRKQTGDDEDAEDLDRPRAEPESERVRRGLARTQQGFMARLNGLLFANETLSSELLDDLEELLVTSDIGVRTTHRLLEGLRSAMTEDGLTDPKAAKEKLREAVLQALDRPCPPLLNKDQPTVIMVIGVNGVGKTTTIGKVAARLIRDGKKVVLGAGDTFRAAAVEQLGIWGDRSGAELVRGADGADPSSVLFDAVQHTIKVGADVCIADTAGRLHTKVNLMEELKKVRRVLEKALPGAPHEVLLVLDATTGQNAIAQAKQFAAAVQVTSVALTKLDGTAKGGVLVAIADVLELPVRFIGIGEGIEDLRDFDAEAFVGALFDETP